MDLRALPEAPATLDLQDPLDPLTGTYVRQ